MIKYERLLFFSLIFFILSCSSDLESKRNSKFIDAISDNEMLEPYIVLTRRENKLIEARSKKLYNKDESALMVGEVVVDFYNEEGLHISKLFADSARINEKNHDLKATGNVYIISDSGYTLSTSNIIWDDSYRMILAQDSVMFTTIHGDTLYGLGFESDSDLEEWKIFKPIGVTREGL